LLILSGLRKDSPPIESKPTKELHGLLLQDSPKNYGQTTRNIQQERIRKKETSEEERERAAQGRAKSQCKGRAFIRRYDCLYGREWQF
jgi:hypothetical protein